MPTPRNATHAKLQRIEQLPAGLGLFSRIVCWTAPYFRSVQPRFRVLEPGHAVATMRKRWRVTNHMGTVHAIAMANLCEFVAGTLMEVSVRPDMRWIPKGLTIRYLAKAQTDLTAECRIDDIEWRGTEDVPVTVTVTDTRGEVVAEAEIPMYVSPRRRSEARAA